MQRGQSGEQNSEMRQQMDKLGEIMRRQQEMMNETFRLDQMQRGQNQRGEQGQGQQGEGQQGEGQPMTPEEFAEALKQLQQQSGNLVTDQREQMGEEVTNPAMDLDLVDQPFFAALDAICAKAGVQPTFYTGDGSIGILNGAPAMPGGGGGGMGGMDF